MKPLSRLLRVASSCLLILLISAGALRAADNDEQILAKMQQDLQALKKQVAATDDIKEQEKLQKEMVSILENALKQVSAKTRPMLEVGVKLLQPLQNDAAEYTATASGFFEGERGDFRALQSREDIASRIKEVEKLEAANRQLLARINSFESDAAAMLKKTGTSEADAAEFMEGFRESTARKMGAMRAIRDLDAKIYAQWKAALALLDSEWGKWHVKGTSPINWDNPETEKKFAAIIAEIQTIAERQATAQRELLSGP